MLENNLTVYSLVVICGSFVLVLFILWLKSIDKKEDLSEEVEIDSKEENEKKDKETNEEQVPTPTIIFIAEPFDPYGWP